MDHALCNVMFLFATRLTSQRKTPSPPNVIFTLSVATWVWMSPLKETSQFTMTILFFWALVFCLKKLKMLCFWEHLLVNIKIIMASHDNCNKMSLSNQYAISQEDIHYFTLYHTPLLMFYLFLCLPECNANSPRRYTLCIPLHI